MAQQQRQQQAQCWGSQPSAWGPSSRPGKLLLGDIESLQQQQLQQQASCSSLPADAGKNAAWRRPRELFVIADSSTHSGGSSETDYAPQHGLQQQQPNTTLQPHSLKLHQQQQQAGLPFWQGASPRQQEAHSDMVQQQRPLALQQHALDTHPKPVVFRPGSIGPQFASATLSGSSSGSGSDSPTALKAVGRIFGSGEACKLLGFIGAQLLMHLASIQHGMHQLHTRQQGLTGHHQQQQGAADGPGFGPWRLRLPWARQEGGGGLGGEGGANNHQGTNSRSSAAWQAGEAARQWVTRGITAEQNIELREALACYTNAVTLEPGNREYLCRLAKQWSDLTYEEGATVEQIQEVNSKAMEYAERVVAMAPKAPDGYLASCVSKGRLALLSDNKTKVRLAKEAQEAARTAVALDPHNDLAHHLMGRWHFEMAQINFVLRQLIRLVYGASLNPGTFDEALTEFQQAVALNPNKLIHRVELGRTHLRLGHKRDAYAHLLASMDLEVEDINAKLQKEDAELLLAKLQSELKGRKELPASWGGFTAPGIAPDETGAAAAAAGQQGSSGSSSNASCKVADVTADDSSSSSSSSSSTATGINAGGSSAA